MKVRQLCVVAALLVGVMTAAHAELIATPLSGDSRLVQFNYDEDNTYLILAKPKAVTHIQFSTDEVLQSVAAGDTAQWELTPTKNRKNIFVKPKYEDIETSMTIITDKRTYQFVLRSTGDKKKWYQRVSWLYGQEMVLESDAQLNRGNPSLFALASTPAQPAPAATSPSSPFPYPPAMNGVPGASAPLVQPTAPAFVESRAGSPALAPESLRFAYEIEGDAAFKPVMAFDDGKFTYLKMPPNLQELPALFAVIDGTDYSLVNYTVRGDYMVAQRLVETAVLKLGKAEVRVQKKKPSASIFHNDNY